MNRYGGKRFRLYVWLSVFVTLFSAVSPAVAGIILADRPAALGRMLGLPAQPVAEHHEHSVHHAAHDGHAAGHAAPAPSDDGAAHDAHGIYCSLCLNATSTVALGAPPQALVILHLGVALLLVERECPPPVSFHPFFRSRAPPLPLPA